MLKGFNTRSAIVLITLMTALSLGACKGKDADTPKAPDSTAKAPKDKGKTDKPSDKPKTPLSITIDGKEMPIKAVLARPTSGDDAFSLVFSSKDGSCDLLALDKEPHIVLDVAGQISTGGGQKHAIYSYYTYATSIKHDRFDGTLKDFKAGKKTVTGHIKGFKKSLSVSGAEQTFEINGDFKATRCKAPFEGTALAKKVAKQRIEGAVAQPKISGELVHIASAGLRKGFGSKKLYVELRSHADACVNSMDPVEFHFEVDKDDKIVGAALLGKKIPGFTNTLKLSKAVGPMDDGLKTSLSRKDAENATLTLDGTMTFKSGHKVTFDGKPIKVSVCK